MAKGKFKNSAPKPSAKPRASLPKAEQGKTAPAGISDELRQAVADLGGDADDLELIAGVDNDDGDEIIASTKPKAMDEVGYVWGRKLTAGRS